MEGRLRILFKEGKKDFYEELAAEFLGLNSSEVSKQQRDSVRLFISFLLFFLLFVSLCCFTLC